MPALVIIDEDSEITYTNYTGSGPLSFEFAHGEKLDVNVDVDGVTLAQSAWVHSPVVADGGYDGGTVTLVTPVAGADVRIWRDMVRLRASQFGAGGANSRAVDTEFNRLVLMAQDARTFLGRSLTSLALITSDVLAQIASVATAISNGDLINRTTQTYATLTAIATADRYDNMLVYVASRASRGDGGEGSWRFDSSSSATANGVTILAPDVGTGRWFRQYTGPLIPEWAGAVGNNTTDCLAAAVACAAISGFIEWGDGDYYFSDDWNITNVPVFMYGAGPKNTRLRFAANKNGIVITNTAGEVERVDIRSIGITTSTTDPVTAGVNKCAISITWAETYDFRAESKGSIQNVAIMGHTSTTMGWHTHIKLTQWVNFDIHQVTITGKDTLGSASATQANKCQSNIGISLLGGVYPVEFRCDQVVINNCDRSVVARGAPEGMYFSQCTFGQTRIGCDIEPTTFSAGIGGGSALYRPLFNMTQCHIWAYQTAVRLYGMIQSHITNNLFYHINDGSQNAELVQLEEAGSVDVKNNKLYTFGTTYTCTGIVVANTGSVIGNTIEGNSFGTMAKGIWLKSTAGRTIVRRNIAEGTYASGFIDNDSTGTILGQRGAMVYLNAATQAIASGAGASVSWDTEEYDTDGFISVTGTTITIPANKGITRVRLSGRIVWQGGSAGARAGAIYKNGNALYPGCSPVSVAPNPSGVDTVGVGVFTSVLTVADGDAFTFHASQNSGVSLDILGAQRCWFQIEVIE